MLGHVHSQCWISEAWSSSRASPGAAPPSEGPAGSAGSVLLSPPSQRWLQQQQQHSPRCTHHPCQRRPPIQTQAIIISVFHRANGLSGNRLFFSPFFF